jgi:xanthine/CO dehydrogenase XdhC/CoxF family maturation factor
MNHNGALLDEFFREYAHAGEPLVLATVVHTIGSTYRKAGAQMLIAADGRSAGLLSGGCLEADLLERARSVLDAGRALVVDYDSRSSDDILWGMGLGCEGAMRILLSRLDRESGYEPYAFQVRCRERDQHGSIALVIESQDAAYPLGGAYRSDAPADLPAPLRAALAKNVVSDPTAHPAVSTIAIEGAKALVMPVVLPLRLLVLGAGPDAVPLVEIAGLMGWNITVRDHRPAYAVRERFPRARSVYLAPAVSLAEELQRTAYDAAIVMSHHLPSDEAYLAALADSDIRYIGLLGPAPRRARLMHEIGAKAQALDKRLYGPVGLDIGATTPESIALAIVSEIQAVKSGRSGASFSRKERIADTEWDS